MAQLIINIFAYLVVREEEEMWIRDFFSQEIPQQTRIKRKTKSSLALYNHYRNYL